MVRYSPSNVRTRLLRDKPLSRNHERITNEAKALELVARETTIPAPRLLDHGIHPDGRRYLITELIEGVLLNHLQTKACSQPEEQKHSEETPCNTCLKEAFSNAIQFIETIVLPQLAKLKSRERGIDGFVMPPSWMSPDMEPPWAGKTSWKTPPLEEAEYVFQHGDLDLAAQNLIMDPQTLQVKALIDWEYAGFYPVGMEFWPGTLDQATYRQRGSKVASVIAKCLPEEYLECYEAWADKEQLRKLIEEGELPHPDACQKCRV